MIRGRTYAIAGGLVLGAAAVIWVAASVPDSWRAPAVSDAPRPSAAPAGDAVRRIKATLFYVAEDGLGLIGVERDVPYGDTPSEQARYIVEAQLAEAPPPLASAVPAGTKLRTLFVTDRGDAFVDLSREVTEHHTGGSLDELFTVYAIVNAVGRNLPAISAVQILIDGREVETLAGHVDLRHPLATNLKWVKRDGTF